MAKAAMACPFSNRPCTECAVYRGRHHYLGSPRDRGTIHQNQQGDISKDAPLQMKIQALRKSVEPGVGKYKGKKSEPRIRLKVIDMESGATRFCDPVELKDWDWKNPRIWRIVDGRQVTDAENLIEILCYKAESGCEEAELYEAPRFMLLAGG